MGLNPKSVVLGACDVGVDYDRAFAKVIHRRWNDTPDEQRIEAESTKRRGQLAPDASGSSALLDTYNYQRGHADVFKKAYKESPHTPPRMGQRLLVVDIGAGAATVAVALREALGLRQRQRVDYVAFHPNPMMRKLGWRILQHLHARFNSAEYVASLEEVDLIDVDRVLFTFSYVVHQRTIAPAHIEGWVRIIKRALVEANKAVELIYTTAGNFEGGAHIHLKQMLKEAKIHRKPRTIEAQVRRRFPESVSSDGRIIWEVQRSMWDVDAEHWTLSA